MPGKITNRLRLLLAEKATREHRNIPLKQLQRETGIAWSTLNSWANNQISRFDAIVIAALCEYFECDVGGLLRYEAENPGKN